MNYCLIINDFKAGGAQKANIDLIKGLINFGHSVTIIVVENKIELDIPIGIPIYFLQNKGERNQGYFGKISLKKKLKEIWNKLNASKRFDATISRLQFSNEITILAKIPNSYFIIDNSLPEEVKKLIRQNLFKGLRRKYRYITLYKDKNLLPVSDGIQSDLIDYFKFNKKHITVIYNPIDFEAIRELSNNKSTSLLPFKYIIHVARAIGQKRHDLLIDAWKLVKSEYQLVLLTDDVKKIERLVAEREMQSKCVVLPFSKNPYPLMKRARLVVISSDFEGAPLVIPESIVCGTPIISTNCNHGPLEILGLNYKSNLVPTNNSIALSKKIIQELSNKKIAMDVNLERFAIKNIIKAYERLSSHQSAIFIKAKNIGDSIILSSAINAMPKEFRVIDILCLPESEDIFKMNPRVSNIFIIPRNKTGIDKWKSYFQILRKIINNNYELVIQFSNDWRGALIARFQKTAYKIAYSHPKRGKAWENSFTNIIAKDFQVKHATDIDLALLRSANLYSGHKTPDYILDVPLNNIKKNKKLLSLNGITFKKKIVLLHTQSRWKFKNLPVKTAADLINLLHRKNFEIILSGSNDDYLANKEIFGLTKSKPVLLKNLSLIDTAAIMKISDYIITIDSMTLHMASALKIPTLAIFGPTDEKTWGPKGTNFKIVALNQADSPKFKCRPCLNSGCNNSKISECLTEMPGHYIFNNFIEFISALNKKV